MRQRDFAEALLDPHSGLPDGIVARKGTDPFSRFRIYRNNYIVKLIEALATTFNVTQQLVGEEFFRAMASLYVYAYPPRVPLLVSYGAEFPEFIENFPPASGLPYLGDVARVEYLRVIAYHATDVPSVDVNTFTGLLAEESDLTALGVTLHPSLSVLPSEFSVVSLWAAHQEIKLPPELSTDVSEVALILRQGLEVEVIQISDAEGVFICELQEGASFDVAATEALSIDVKFDVASSLGLLLQKSAITAFTSTRRTT